MLLLVFRYRNKINFITSDWALIERPVLCCALIRQRSDLLYIDTVKGHRKISNLLDLAGKYKVVSKMSNIQTIRDLSTVTPSVKYFHISVRFPSLSLPG